MSRADWTALFLSLAAVVAAYLVGDRIFEHMAHIEDEMAYVWQAQAISRGKLTLPTPPEPESFLIPFVVDYQGQRFGKYPLGWPVVLSLGMRLGVPEWVNPLLAGLGVWLTYSLGRRVFGKPVGLLAALLTVTSPFFLMNSGSLLSHPLGLVLSAGFALAWLDAFFSPQAGSPRRLWLAALTAALTLGMLILTRPLTAAAVVLPFGLHGLFLLWRGDWAVRWRLLSIGVIALCFAGVHFLWQYALTGDAFLNPYTLWWSYDKVGFGPGYGVAEYGHSLAQARMNTRFSLRSGWHDLFGWAGYSWIFLPFGLLAIWRSARTLILASVFPSLVLAYMAYWIGASLFGPRYYYEALYSLTLVSAAGIAWLARWPVRPGEAWPNYAGWLRLCPLGITALLALLLSANLLFYTPQRLQGMRGLYGVSGRYLEPFLSPNAQQFTPALISVHTSGKWITYGRLLHLENAFLDTPFIFVVYRGSEVTAALAAQFPERAVYHYYPDAPYEFYTAERPAP